MPYGCLDSRTFAPGVYSNRRGASKAQKLDKDKLQIWLASYKEWFNLVVT
jgi:hypothetical protein